MPYTEEGYMKLGRNLARTFLDYYKLTNYITVKPTSGTSIRNLPIPIMFVTRYKRQKKLMLKATYFS